jgi:signal transduction histidine kinase
MTTPTLLVNVDDKEAARYAKTRTLRHAGFEVVEGGTGSEALQLVGELSPPLILLDVKLPDMSGIDVCRQIKRDYPSTLVLQTSASFVTSGDRVRGLDSGADAYLIQPAEPAELVAAVNALLRIRRAEDELRRVNETLEARVAERTEALARSNQQLIAEIAERRRAEAALVQAQKMEAVGQLTGGLAHDFNNLLAAIVGNLDLIRRRAGDERVARLAENALSAAERGAKLTGQLLAFSRTQKLSLQPVRLNQLVSGMKALLTQSLGPLCEIALDLDPGVDAVLADGNQLELGVLNLAINARDAMPEGGRIEIATGLHSVSVADGDLAPGLYATVTVTDQGAGMAPEVAARAFDPFFTTKPVGKGTGLGLSQVYGTARQCGGSVRLVSEVGRGTTVTLLLPAAEGVGEVPAPREPPAAPGRNEVVLVVDDDPDVRILLAELLGDLGYSMRNAADGEAGLAALADGTVDLIISDFAMPGMNGADFAQAARALRPELPILFTSGHADSRALEAAVGGAPILMKPFRYGELAEAIRKALGTE